MTIAITITSATIAIATFAHSRISALSRARAHTRRRWRYGVDSNGEVRCEIGGVMIVLAMCLARVIVLLIGVGGSDGVGECDGGA